MVNSGDTQQIHGSKTTSTTSQHYLQNQEPSVSNLMQEMWPAVHCRNWERPPCINEWTPLQHQDGEKPVAPPLCVRRSLHCKVEWKFDELEGLFVSEYSIVNPWLERSVVWDSEYHNLDDAWTQPWILIWKLWFFSLKVKGVCLLT